MSEQIQHYAPPSPAIAANSSQNQTFLQFVTKVKVPPIGWKHPKYFKVMEDSEAGAAVRRPAKSE
jgi:hypothetical protein